MSLFNESSRFTIEGGSFIAVAGSQHVYNNIIQSQRKERAQTVLDQYQRVPTGKVHLKRKLAESEVKRWDTKGWRDVDARRTICAAAIRGEDKGEEFLHVQYSGPDAFKAYERDFKIFSSVKDINYIQLFGYSDWEALPTLIFYDALVPVSRIWERNKFSPILFTYFSYQAVVAQGLQRELPLPELWVNPRDGELCRGPYVEHAADLVYEPPSFLNASKPEDGRSFLTLGTYGDNNLLLEYLNGTLSTGNIIRGICRSNQATFYAPEDEDAKSILSSLPGAVYRRTSMEIVTRYPGEELQWYYEAFERFSDIPDVLRESICKMKDGSVRITLTRSGLEELGPFEVCYVLRPWESWFDLVTSWLSQAHGISSQLGLGHQDWREYAVFCTFRLIFKCEQRAWQTAKSQKDLHAEMPFYLFIRPIPRPYCDENKWKDWFSERKYYWSLDDSGTEEISVNASLDWGLPSFETTLGVWHTWWDYNVYDAIQMVHHTQGFEHTSLDLATSLGDTILDVICSNLRFEEIKGIKCCLDHSSISTNTNTDDLTSLRPTIDVNKFLGRADVNSVSSSSQEGIVDSDEDVDMVLYPRLCAGVHLG